MTRDPLAEPPGSDADVRAWLDALGVPGLVDVHVHFMPDRLLQRVWSYFDEASRHYGVAWPVAYRLPEAERLAVLRDLGVTGFAPLLYAHKPGMAAALTAWGMAFGRATPGAVPTATLHPEDDDSYLLDALRDGARCVKAHVQVGGYDPRDPRLDRSWGALADAGVPVVVHCGHGPIPGAHTGVDVFGEVLRRHPGLTAVLAHAGMPEFDAALRLVATYERVHLDTTMVGVPFTEALSPLPPDWAARLADHPGRVVLGTDFPNIPYDYATQLRAIAGWGAATDRLGAAFVRDVVHGAPSRLLRLTPAAAPAYTGGVDPTRG